MLTAGRSMLDRKRRRLDTLHGESCGGTHDTGKRENLITYCLLCYSKPDVYSPDDLQSENVVYMSVGCRWSVLTAYGENHTNNVNDERLHHKPRWRRATLGVEHEFRILKARPGKFLRSVDSACTIFSPIAIDSRVHADRP